jgi:excisionase family DNA binding protein
MNEIKTRVLLIDDEKTEINPAVFTVTQVATLLQLSRSSVYRLVAKGLLPRLAGIRAIRVPREGLDEYLVGRKNMSVRIPDCVTALYRPGNPQKRGKGREADPNRHGLFRGIRGPQKGAQGRKKDKGPNKYGF